MGWVRPMSTPGAQHAVFIFKTPKRVASLTHLTFSPKRNKNPSRNFILVKKKTFHFKTRKISKKRWLEEKKNKHSWIGFDDQNVAFVHIPFFWVDFFNIWLLFWRWNMSKNKCYEKNDSKRQWNRIERTCTVKMYLRNQKLRDITCTKIKSCGPDASVRGGSRTF